MNRITSSSTPILDVMTSEEISAMEADRAKSEVKTEKFMESQRRPLLNSLKMYPNG